MSNSKTIKTLVQLGSALAATRAARSVSSLEADDVLGWIGLARRRSYFWENLALVGVGAVVGATGALLLAPASGRETRKRIGGRVQRLGDEATQKLDEVRERANEMVERRVLGDAPGTRAMRGNMGASEHHS
jgi:YtxH-like protein